MPRFLVVNNIHLGLELIGAIIFFIISWLFFEGFLKKRDRFDLGKTLGFLFLSGAQVFHALYSSNESLLLVAPVFYNLGLVMLVLSYGLQKSPSRPNISVSLSAAFILPGAVALLNNPLTTLIFSSGLTLVLVKRFFVDFEKGLKFLIFGFVLLDLSFLISIFSNNVHYTWILEHVLKILGLFLIGAWGWRLLSLRIREEALIVFVATSMFIALLVTTTFSSFFLKKVEKEAQINLEANAKVFNFYIDSLKNKALSSAYIVAQNEALIGAVKEKDLADLGVLTQKLISETGVQFLTVAQKNGNVLFKFNFPILSGENILIEKIGSEAAEGRFAVTIDLVEAEGFSVRAAAPIFSSGKIIGVLITGFLLNDNFAEGFKSISNLETTLFADKRVVGSTLFDLEDSIDKDKLKTLLSKDKAFLGQADFFGTGVLGSFLPLRDIDNSVVGYLAITTAPGELVGDAQATNRLTMIIIFLIVLALVIPLYRFTVFLTS